MFFLITLTAALLLKNYFLPQFQIILGVMIAPFVFRIKEKFVFSNRYFYISLFLMAIYLAIGLKIFLFLSIGCLLFFAIENIFGKIGSLPLFFLVFISPVFNYIINVFTFTFRLALSKYAAEILCFMGYPVECNGNYFILPDGFTFNVDKACLGLNMFNTGLSLTVLLIALMEKRLRKSLSLPYLTALFSFTVIFLIATNFLRIITIVLFKSMPETLSHEMIGIFSLILYTAVPMYFLILFLIKRFGRTIVINEGIVLKPSKRSLALTFTACALLFLSFTYVEKSSKTEIKDLKLENLTLDGFTKSKKEDGVMEFRKNDLLVYIKPGTKFYGADHPPSLCWKGSGFDVEETTEEIILDQKIMTAVIKKGNTIQYTAWWHDNGTIRTTDQWTWRSTRGEPFRIINLTTNTKEDLILNCKIFLQKKLF